MISIYIALTGCLPYDREGKRGRIPPALKCICDGNVDYLLGFYNLMQFMNGFALDLLQRIFVPQRYRITVSDIVAHPLLVCTAFLLHCTHSLLLMNSLFCEPKQKQNLEGCGGNMLINGYISEICQVMEGYDDMDTVDDIHPFIMDWIYGYYGKPGRDVWESSDNDSTSQSISELEAECESTSESESESESESVDEEEEELKMEMDPLLSSNSATSNASKRLSLSFTNLMDPMMERCRLSDSDMDDDEFWEIPNRVNRWATECKLKVITSELQSTESGSLLSQSSDCGYEVVDIC